MASIKYGNDIAPAIVEEVKENIFTAAEEKGYIDSKNGETIECIEEHSIEICSIISLKMTEYFRREKPNEVNVYAPICSSYLAVLAGMVLTKEWAEGNNNDPEEIFDDMLYATTIDILDEYMLPLIGIDYKSDEYENLNKFTRDIYVKNWIYMNEEANRQGIGSQIMFVVDSLKIMFSLGMLIEKKRLGIS